MGKSEEEQEAAATRTKGRPKKRGRQTPGDSNAPVYATVAPVREQHDTHLVCVFPQ